MKRLRRQLRQVAGARANLQELAGFGLVVAGCWRIDETLAYLVAGGGMLAGLLIEGFLHGDRK